MKRTELKGIKEHFKDATKVRCLVNRKIYKIDVDSVHFDYGIYWADSDTGYVAVWQEDLGFAEIVETTNN